MKTIENLYKGFNVIKLIGIIISGIFIFVMMGYIVADVITRNLFGGSLTGSIEFVQYYFMPLAVFPGLAYVYGSGMLPKLELLIERFKDKNRIIMVNFLLLVEIALFSIVIYYTFYYAISGVNNELSFTTGGSVYPFYYLLFMVPVAFLMVAIENLFIFISNIINKQGKFTVKLNE